MNNRDRNEKRLFKRLLHSHHDLVHARSCAEQILKRKLHDAPRGDDRELLECLNTALIVSYWRPFSGNRNSRDVQATLPDGFLRELAPEEKALHQNIRRSRDRDQAHSDPEARSISVTVDELFEEPVATPVGRDPFVPLPVEDVRLLLSMIDKLLDRIVTEQQRIVASLPVGDSF